MTAVKANGITIEYEEKGNGHDPAVVLIRGLGTQLIDWPQDLIDGLADRSFRVIYFDNRDVGLSEKMEAAGTPNVADMMAKTAAGETVVPPYTISDMAMDVVGLLDELDVSSAHIFGISMGGMIAQTLAALHRNRVKSLISVMSTSGNPNLPTGQSEAMARMMTPPPDPGDREGVIAHMAETLRVIGSPGYPESVEKRRQIAARRFDRCFYPEGVSRQLAAVIADGSRVEMLKTIDVPTLVIHGIDDPLVPVEAGKDTAVHIPGALLHIFERMGHSIPDALVSDLIDLISGMGKNLD